MNNLEPVEEKDLDLEGKFKKPPEPEEEFAEKEAEKEPGGSQEISVAEKDTAYSKILNKVQQHPKLQSNDEEIKKDAESTFQKVDAQSQIQHLVDLALTKGVIHAVKVARHLEDNYVLDVFHDRLLADDLHEALIKEGLIKEI
jgi:hypothetical protein